MQLEIGQIMQARLTRRGAPVQDPRSSHRRSPLSLPLSPHQFAWQEASADAPELEARRGTEAWVLFFASSFAAAALQAAHGTRVAMIRRPASFFPLPR